MQDIPSDLTVKDLLRNGSLLVPKVVGEKIAERLMRRTTRRPAGSSVRLFRLMGVDDPFENSDSDVMSSSLYVAKRFASIDKEAERQKPKHDYQPEAPRRPVSMAEPINKSARHSRSVTKAAPSPLPGIEEPEAPQKGLGKVPHKPKEPRLGQPKRSVPPSTTKSGRFRMKRAKKRTWEASPEPVVVKAKRAPESPAAAPTPPKAPVGPMGLDDLFGAGPRLKGPSRKKRTPSDDE